MEIAVPKVFIVRECPRCHTRHAPIRDCPEREDREFVMIGEDTMLYRCAGVLAILVNVLATAMFLALPKLGPFVPVGIMANLFSYAILLSALRGK